MRFTWDSKKHIFNSVMETQKVRAKLISVFACTEINNLVIKLMLSSIFILKYIKINKIASFLNHNKRFYKKINKISNV